MTEEKTDPTDELCVIRDMLKLLEPLKTKEAIRAAEYVLRRAKDRDSEEASASLSKAFSQERYAAMGASKRAADWMTP